MKKASFSPFFHFQSVAKQAIICIDTAAHRRGLGSCWIHRARQEFESAEGKALMKKYQSLEAIREATEEDLAQTDSMSPQAAHSVYRFFREKERENQPSD